MYIIIYNLIEVNNLRHIFNAKVHLQKHNETLTYYDTENKQIYMLKYIKEPWVYNYAVWWFSAVTVRAASGYSWRGIYIQARSQCAQTSQSEAVGSFTRRDSDFRAHRCHGNDRVSIVNVPRYLMTASGGSEKKPCRVWLESTAFDDSTAPIRLAHTKAYPNLNRGTAI